MAHIFPQPEPAKDNRPIIYLPRLQLTKAVFDTSMLIAFLNHDQCIRQHIGNPQIFHSEVTDREWRGHFLYHENRRRKDLGQPPRAPDPERDGKKADRALAVFDSTFLSETPQVNAIAAEIRRCLLLADIEELMDRDLSDNDQNDIRTAAYAMAYRMDVVAADRLFYTIGQMFRSDSTAHVNRKRNRPWQAIELLARLEAKGTETPAELAHLIGLNSSKDIRASASDTSAKGGEADENQAND